MKDGGGPSFLQNTVLLKGLPLYMDLPNCLQLYHLAQVYGLPNLQDACLCFMSMYAKQVLCQPHFPQLAAPPPSGLKT